MPYLLDPIHKATLVSRPKQSGLDLVGHWGIVVENKSGRYLVHNVPKTGLVATLASNMSEKWEEQVQIEVKGEKNIHGMFKSTGFAAYLPPGLVKYLAQFTCIGSAQNAMGYLSS